MRLGAECSFSCEEDRENYRCASIYRPQRGRAYITHAEKIPGLGALIEKLMDSISGMGFYYTYRGMQLTRSQSSFSLHLR